MATVPTIVGAQRQLELQRVDCDVHPNFRAGLKDLDPYLSAAYRRRVGIGQDAEWSKDVAASHFSLPTNVMYINPAGAMRRDTATDGSAPASNPAVVAEQLLDQHNIDRAVLLGGNILGLGGLTDPDLATALANAYNQWLYEQWLQFDERYRGGIVVAIQDIDAAVATIRTFAEKRGFVQVHVPMNDQLLGERRFRPIYAAAQSYQLPVAVHPNAIDGVFRTGPAMAGGQPTYYTEWHTGLTQVFQANVISLVCQGTFEAFPDLRVVVTEGGFAWLPDVMWRLDKNWRGLRDELPWLTRAPSDYIIDHIRFTTQPFVEPKKREHLEVLCDIISADRTLLFSTDYPHWDFDDPDRALRSLPPYVRARIFAKNALEIYGEHIF
jgi:predicted TIM-barrel fold metal-dependent hydrolase